MTLNCYYKELYCIITKVDCQQNTKLLSNVHNTLKHKTLLQKTNKFVNGFSRLKKLKTDSNASSSLVQDMYRGPRSAGDVPQPTENLT